MIEIVQGNLLDSTEKYIAHQCNCVTNNCAGIAKRIFEKYPYSNIYEDRITHNIPGSIIIKGNGQDERFVINLLAQYYPGKPLFPNGEKDGRITRLNYLKKCLDQVSEIKNLESIAFPYKMGCNLGGGYWPDYLRVLEDFSDKTNAKAKIYQLDK